MKNVKNLMKLTNVNSERLKEKQMNHVLGGGEPGRCHCGCFYSACGGSSRSSNDGANNEKGYYSPLPPFDDPNWGIAT